MAGRRAAGLAAGAVLLTLAFTLWYAEISSLESYSQHVEWLFSAGEKPVPAWSEDDVARFLDSRGLARHEPAFREAHIDGPGLLAADEGRLLGLGMEDELERKSLLWDIAHMRSQLPLRDASTQTDWSDPVPAPAPAPVPAPVIVEPPPDTKADPPPDTPPATKTDTKTTKPDKPDKPQEPDCNQLPFDWQAIQWPEATCEAILERDTEEPLFVPFYKCIYEEMVVHKTRPLKFAGYRQGDNTGWGNRMRGTVTGFNLALAMGRVFFNMHELFETFFDEPNAHVQTFWPNARKEAEPKGQMLSLKVLQRPKMMAIVEKGDLEREWGRYSFIEHYQGNAFDQHLWRNPKLQPRFRALFRTESRFERTGMIMQFLLAAPKQNLLDDVADVRALLQMDRFQRVVAVQTRTMKDTNAAHERWLEHKTEYWECAQSFLRGLPALTDKPEDTLIYFATDDDDARVDAERYLGEFGHVANNGLASTHTAKFKGGVSGAMIDWYVMGTVDRILHSGTTFGIFAVARTNYCNGRMEVAHLKPTSKEWTCDAYLAPDKRKPAGEDVQFR